MTRYETESRWTKKPVVNSRATPTTMLGLNYESVSPGEGAGSGMKTHLRACLLQLGIKDSDESKVQGVNKTYRNRIEDSSAERCCTF